MLTPVLKKIYLKTEEDKELGPCLDSENIEERIAARRLRIKKRVEIRNKPKDQNSDLDKIIKPLSYKQIEFSYQKLQKLVHDGKEFISNIRIATDARETLRRADEEELSRIRIEKLESEAQIDLENFQNISKKWEKYKKMDVPHDLQQLLNTQLKDCSELIERKSQLIKELHAELKSKDDQYVKELKRRAEDIDLLVERIEGHFKLMTTAFSDELTSIEQAFISQRQKLLEQQNTEWHQILDEIKSKQTQFIEDRETKLEEIHISLSELRITHAEEYNILKCKLENDVQLLEQRLETMKANFLLNLEKLEYNFQVLKRRDEENILTKSNQKRKITRILDHLNAVRKKAKQMVNNFKVENAQLVEDLHLKMKALHKLSIETKNLMEQESKIYLDMWLMNEDKCKELALVLLKGDRTITEQQLGLEYKETKLLFLENKGPVGINNLSGPIEEEDKDQSIFNKISPALLCLQFAKTERTVKGQGLELKPRDGTKIRNLLPEIVQQFIDCLCHEAAFLIEEGVLSLLEPLNEEDQRLLKLDSIFNSLNIRNENDLDNFISFFLITPDSERDSELDDEDCEETRNKDFEVSNLSILISETQFSRAISQFTKTQLAVTSKAKYSNQKILTQEEEKNSVQENVNIFKMTEKARQKYWRMYSECVIHPEKEATWDLLIDALHKYEKILMSRKRLLDKNNTLKQHNEELRFLLGRYKNSDIERSLLIPSFPDTKF